MKASDDLGKLRRYRLKYVYTAKIHEIEIQICILIHRNKGEGSHF